MAKSKRCRWCGIPLDNYLSGTRSCYSHLELEDRLRSEPEIALKMLNQEKNEYLKVGTFKRCEKELPENLNYKLPLVCLVLCEDWQTRLAIRVPNVDEPKLSQFAWRDAHNDDHYFFKVREWLPIGEYVHMARELTTENGLKCSICHTFIDGAFTDFRGLKVHPACYDKVNGPEVYPDLKTVIRSLPSITVVSVIEEYCSGDVKFSKELLKAFNAKIKADYEQRFKVYDGQI